MVSHRERLLCVFKKGLRRDQSSFNEVQSLVIDEIFPLKTTTKPYRWRNKTARAYGLIFMLFLHYCFVSTSLCQSHAEHGVIKLTIYKIGKKNLENSFSFYAALAWEAQIIGSTSCQ